MSAASLHLLPPRVAVHHYSMSSVAITIR
ncbi:uncharacterized protein G2W53_003927 [Senna tora]|uniref:Uncharacterized protein n=1 Tax=Senna tora TaxID=362788 RepID=A0A834XB02_9FABA|nr:uncharacterized protein G2W53_003927 [Senna tora]